MTARFEFLGKAICLPSNLLTCLQVATDLKNFPQRPLRQALENKRFSPLRAPRYAVCQYVSPVEVKRAMRAPRGCGSCIARIFQAAWGRGSTAMKTVLFAALIAT